MRKGGFSWLVPRPAAAGSPLPLSSPTKATLLWIIFWRCWAPFEHGIAHPEQGPRIGRDQQHGSTPKGLLSIRFLTKGRAVRRVSVCEGFRTTAHRDNGGRHWGRRRKAPREGTRGELRCGMCHALWRFERPTKASPFWTILCVIRPEPLGRGFGSGNASIEPTTSSRSALRDRPLSFASRHRAEHSTAPSAACH